MKYIRIISTRVIHNFIVEITFNDKKVKILNFGPKLQKNERYRNNPEKFKNDMRNEGNMLCFGDSWNIAFEADKLYLGKIIQR